MFCGLQSNGPLKHLRAYYQTLLVPLYESFFSIDSSSFASEQAVLFSKFGCHGNAHNMIDMKR